MDGEDEAFHRLVFGARKRPYRQKKQPVLPTPPVSVCCRRIEEDCFYPFLLINVDGDWLTVDEAVNRKKAPAEIRRHLLDIYDGKFTYECPTVAYPIGVRGGRCIDGQMGPYYYFSSVEQGDKAALFLGRCCTLGIGVAPIGALDVEKYDSAHWITDDGVEHWVICDCRRFSLLS